MSVRKLAASLVAVIATVIGGQQVGAQEHPPGSWGEPDGILEMDTDFRWFETAYNADIEELSPKHRANHGWYSTYDRVYMSVQRPENEDSSNAFDFAWGSRMDFGYMGDDEHGWAATYWNFGGPDKNCIDVQQRANVLNTEDPILPNAEADVVDNFGQLLPARDRNMRMYLERIYEVKDSLNVFAMKGFELNRTWRLDSYRKGGLLEPLIGLRYMRATDVNNNDAYDVQRVVDVESGLPLTPGIRETFTQRTDDNINSMYGGQLGFRYLKFQNRFTHSMDLRVFAFQNFQSNTFTTQQTITNYDMAVTGEIDGEVFNEDTQTTKLFTQGSEFVYGFDLRAETSLQLTRDIHLRGGVQALDLAQGILRGHVDKGISNRLNDSNALNDQNVWMIGFTFGLTINR